MKKLPNYLTKILVPLGIGFSILPILLFCSDILIRNQLSSLYWDLTVVDIQSNKEIKLSNVNTGNMLLTFFFHFNIDCMIERVESLNHFAKYIIETNNQNTKIVAIFGNNYTMKDIDNFGKICNLSFKSVITTHETFENIMKLNLSNTFTMIVKKNGTIAYYEKKYDRYKSNKISFSLSQFME